MIRSPLVKNLGELRIHHFSAAPIRGASTEGRTSSFPSSFSWSFSRVVRVANGCVTLLLSVAVFSLLASGVPGVFGLGAVRVMGASMGHTVPVGSIAILEQVSAADTRLGDVVLFAGDGTAVPVMHRIVSIKQQGRNRLVVTKGDANPSVDPTPRLLRGGGGRVVTSLPYVGFVLTALRINFVWVLIVCCMIVRLLRGNFRPER